LERYEAVGIYFEVGSYGFLVEADEFFGLDVELQGGID